MFPMFRSLASFVVFLEAIAAAVLVTVVLALSCATAADRAHAGEPGGAGGLRRQIVLRGASFPSSLILLVDASGSMRGEKYAAAVRNALWVARQAGASDDGRLRVAVFASGLTWWTPPAKDRQGKPRDVSGGWLRLPDADGIESARAWLDSREVDGSTAMAEAVEAALAIEPEAPLGVVVVTDEDPDGGVEPTCQRIAIANAQRKAPATIGVIGILPRGATAERLGLIVAKGSGGCYVTVDEKPKASAEAPPSATVTR